MAMNNKVEMLRNQTKKLLSMWIEESASLSDEGSIKKKKEEFLDFAEHGLKKAEWSEEDVKTIISLLSDAIDKYEASKKKREER